MDCARMCSSTEGWAAPHAPVSATSVVTREHRVQLGAAIPEYEPVVAQLLDLGEIEARNEHRFVLFIRLGHLRARGVRDEARSVEADVELVGVLARALDTDPVGDDDG